MWVVFAIKPKEGWVYKDDYFPHVMRYKKDAQGLVERVKEQGIQAVLVKEEDLPEELSKIPANHYIVRCERDDTIFTCEPPEPNAAGRRHIDCPTCGRGYEFSIPKQIWYADRNLTILRQPHDPHIQTDVLLSFQVPEKDVAVFATGVIDTLEALEIRYECDETSPPNEQGIVTYRVFK